MHHVLAIFSAGKFHNGPATISTESIAGLAISCPQKYLHQYGAEFCRQQVGSS